MNFVYSYQNISNVVPIKNPLFNTIVTLLILALIVVLIVHY